MCGVHALITAQNLQTDYRLCMILHHCAGMLIFKNISQRDSCHFSYIFRLFKEDNAVPSIVPRENPLDEPVPKVTISEASPTYIPLDQNSP